MALLILLNPLSGEAFFTNHICIGIQFQAMRGLNRELRMFHLLKEQMAKYTTELCIESFNQ